MSQQNIEDYFVVEWNGRTFYAPAMSPWGAGVIIPLGAEEVNGELVIHKNFIMVGHTFHAVVEQVPHKRIVDFINKSIPRIAQVSKLIEMPKR